MATLKIDGKRIKVDDSFLQMSPDEQAAFVDEIAADMAKGAQPAAAPASGEGDVSASNLAKAGLRGIPIVGGMMNRAAATIDAATQPVLGGLSGSQAGTYAERVAENMKANQANEAAFREQSPIASTGAEIAGGVGAMLPLAATQVGAKILGMSGTLPQMVTRGAASGAGIGAADAAIRGQDPTTGAEVGGAVGAAMPVVGRGIGAGVRAVQRAVAPAAPPVAQQTVRVGNVDVPITQSQLTGDAAQSAEEQILGRGGRGIPAQEVVQDFRTLQQGRLRQASDEIAAGLDPTGRSTGTTPQAAAQAVSGELGMAERAAEAAQQARAAAAATEGQALRQAAGGGQTVADAPFTAGEILSAGIRGASDAARAARTNAYTAAREVEGEFAPAAFNRVGNSLRQRLNAGNDPVLLSERKTPEAVNALEEVDQRLFQNVGQPPSQIGPDGRPIARPITGTEIDELRKRLVAYQRDANAAARSSGDRTDVRAMQRVMEAFDDHVREAVQGGAFSGDGRELLRRLTEARRLHGEYRRTFTRQGPNDEVGTIIEKIIGRYEGQQATPDQIAQWAFGSVADPGGATAIKVGQRLRQIFGPDSREWAAYRQGLLAHLTETAPGTGARTPEQIAARVDNFLNGTKGRGLAQLAFSPAERQRLANYAGQVRASAPAERPADVVSRVMARISGADGQLPASVNEITGYLYGNGMGDPKVSVQLARRLKTELTPESWTAVRQGMWSQLTEVPQGMIEKKEQALSQQLHNFLNGKGQELAEVMFTQRERELMTQMANAYKRMIPVEGTTNPSGTAPMFAKIVAKAQSVLLPLLGFSQGGMIGAAAGVAAQKGMERVVTRQAAKDATRRFYGEQPRAMLPPTPTYRGPAIAGQGAAPALTE